MAVGRVGLGGRSTMNVKECRGERLSNRDDGETPHRKVVRGYVGFRRRCLVEDADGWRCRSAARNCCPVPRRSWQQRWPLLRTRCIDYGCTRNTYVGGRDGWQSIDGEDAHPPAGSGGYGPPGPVFQGCEYYITVARAVRCTSLTGVYERPGAVMEFDIVDPKHGGDPEVRSK